ncbi:hypothetical protein [Enterovirga sp.]|uniref:hypothetical protein n=1 Tax=Enterovirga sp. TaxID=2026350 RepID=UPI0026261E4C|nr:hypothetical protein [Enterovirga sp.]
MVAAAGVALAMFATSQAYAQASGCGDLQAHLGKRKAIADKLTVSAGKQMDAKIACQGFTQLVANGTEILKWANANKDWCQIPESFIASITADHSKATQIRGRACNVAAKQTEMEKQAKSGGGGGQQGLLGGNGLSGSMQVPQGAL